MKKFHLDLNESLTCRGHHYEVLRNTDILAPNQYHHRILRFKITRKPVLGTFLEYAHFSEFNLLCIALDKF